MLARTALALEVTTSELRVELMYPANNATDVFFKEKLARTDLRCWAEARMTGGHARKLDTSALADWVVDAKRAALGAYDELSDHQLVLPYLEIINPPLWELGHVAWFQEFWVLRHALGGAPQIANADELWN